MSFGYRILGFGSFSGVSDYVINGSGLFDGDSGQLSRTPSSAGNQDTFVVDVIFKNTMASTNGTFFAVNPTSSQSDTNSFGVQYITSGSSITIRITGWTNNWVETTAQFRDPTGWTHMVVAADSTDSTAGDRIRIWFNGVAAPVTTIATKPQNDNFGACGTEPHEIGSYAGGGNFAAEYLARVALLDGLSITDPTTDGFGEVTDDGIWQPKDISKKSFGTTGFLIEGGTDMAAGTDSSTNFVTDYTSLSSASGLYSGDTDDVTFSGDDLSWNVGDDAIYTTSTYTGDIDLEFTIQQVATENTFGFAKSGFTFASSSSAGLYGTTDGFVLRSQTVATGNKMSWSDWSNTNNGPEVGSSGTINNPSAGDVINLRRDASSGTVQVLLNGSLVIQGSDSYTGALHVIFAEGGTSPQGDYDNITIKHGGNVGNYFAPTATITATNDSPINDAVNNYGNYCTLNPLDTFGSPALSDGNLTHVSASAQKSVCGTIGITTGKWYYEVTQSTTNAGGTGEGVGIVNDLFAPVGGTQPGSMSTGWICKLDHSGSDKIQILHNGTAYNSDTNSTTSMKICVAIDGDAEKVWFGRISSGSRTWFGSISGSGASSWADTGGDPANGTNPTIGSGSAVSLTGSTWRIISDIWYGGATAGHTYNFGLTAFDVSPPTNFKALATHNMAEPTVPNYEDEYFIKTGISHSNGSTTAVTLPKTVSGGAMVRIKRTDSTSDWYVVDTVRGANKFIDWNTQDAEDTSSWSDQNLTSTTLTLPSALASGTYLIECFYVGSYFQIKAFTGNASAHAETFDSALSGEFGAAFVKNRTDSGSPGASFFQHKSLGGTKYLHPYSTDDVQTNIVGWNNTAATTTQITVGTHNGVNGDGDAMIVYAWANSGPYRFGEVNSNNISGDDFMVYVGGFPQTKFVKKHNTTEGWYFSAYAIDGYNPTKYMSLDSTIAAAADVAYDHLANGFKSRDTTTSTRGSGHTLVWGAFGITPFALNNRAR